jgi:hypothetical protein
MSHVDKSRVMQHGDQSRSAPGETQIRLAPHKAPGSHLPQRSDTFALAQWSTAIVAAAAALCLAWGTSWRQLAIGVLGSLVCTSIGLFLVEIASRFVVAARSGRKRSNASTEPSSDHIRED